MDATCSLTPAAPAVAAATPPSRGWKWWLIPDVALVLALVSLFYVLVLFDGTRELLRDGDAGWHIRAGESILSGHGLPRTDSWSLLHAGKPWFAWEWASDVVMGYLHQRGGLAAVTGFFATALAAAVWLGFRLSRRLGGHFLIAALGTPVVLMSTQIHWHARPHILSWVFILAALHYAERPRRSLWVVALGTAVWANIHASFFFAGVIAAVYSTGRFLAPLIWEDVDRSSSWRDARWFFIAGAVTVAASFANPYGWHLHQHLFLYLTNSELLSHIGEFHSFNFFSDGAAPILLMLGLAGVGAVLSFSQRRLDHALLVGLLAAIALRSARGLPVLALVSLPIANRAITQALSTAGGLRWGVRRRIDGFLTYGNNLWNFDRSFAGPIPAAVAGLIVVFALSLPEVAKRANFPDREFPVQAAEVLKDVPASARILAPDIYGGYLIYRFNGARKVYFDGRSDFYGSEYMKEYLDLIEARPGWPDKVRKIGFDFAILPKRYALIPGLEMLGWTKIHTDEYAVVLKAPARLARGD